MPLLQNIAEANLRLTKSLFNALVGQLDYRVLLCSLGVTFVTRYILDWLKPRQGRVWDSNNDELAMMV